MTPAAQSKAKAFAEALMMPELKDKRFPIEGRTDLRGPHDVNVDLSRRRAVAPSRWRISSSQGVEPSRGEVKGIRPDEPLPGLSAAAEANRRVEALLPS